MEVTFEEIKDFENSDDVLIVDVREPDEVESTGLIGGSINIPLSTLEESFALSDEEFQEKYGKPKPALDFPIIFSCRSGERAAKAQEAATALGFIEAKVYPGSWNEWAEKNDLN